MKTRLLLLVLLLNSHICFSQQEKSLFLTGASFGIVENGWFELACEALHFKPVNKSISSTAIMHSAVAMKEGTLYTMEELEWMEAFVIMHVHNQDVADTKLLKEDYNEYLLSDTTDYSMAYDYVIRKYMDDCKNLKHEPTSRYYGKEEGKPAVIILCTHWHDARTIYNDAIRVLSAKWDLPLVEWDMWAGFTQHIPEDDGGSHSSRKYSYDIDPTLTDAQYGWHPNRGKGEYIQQKMAEVFANKVIEVLGIESPEFNRTE